MLGDIQQIEYLGKRLNFVQLVKEAYKLATKELFGHLNIDLDPKTIQGLRFSSQIVGPESSTFYVPGKQAIETATTNEKETFA